MKVETRVGAKEGQRGFREMSMTLNRLGRRLQTGMKSET